MHFGEPEADLAIFISLHGSELLANASDLHCVASQLLEAVCRLPSSEFVDERNEEPERLTKLRLQGEIISKDTSQNPSENCKHKFQQTTLGPEAPRVYAVGNCDSTYSRTQ